MDGANPISAKIRRMLQLDALLLGAFASWRLWALAHADRIDPLHDNELFDLQVEDYEVYSLRE